MSCYVSIADQISFNVRAKSENRIDSIVKNLATAPVVSTIAVKIRVSSFICSCLPIVLRAYFVSKYSPLTPRKNFLCRKLATSVSGSSHEDTYFAFSK